MNFELTPKKPTGPNASQEIHILPLEWQGMCKRTALIACLTLCMSFLPQPVAADRALEWEQVDIPGDNDLTVVSPSEVTDIAVGDNGVIYAVDGENGEVYRSLDYGVSWEEITEHLSDAGASLPATMVAVAPDNEGIVAALTDGGSALYVSLDGGWTWDDTHLPILSGAVTALALSPKYAAEGKAYREIAIGTAVWGDDTSSGQVWVLQGGYHWAAWEDQSIEVMAAYPGAEVAALAYSPDFVDDWTLVVAGSTAGDVPAGSENRTWMFLGERDPVDGGTDWDSFDDFPLELVAAGDGPGVESISMSLALPSNFSSQRESSIGLFTSFDREPDAGDDVYRVDTETVLRLEADGGSDVDIASIAYHGTLDEGVLLAGDRLPVAGRLTVQVRSTDNPFDEVVQWDLSDVPPTGPGNAVVAWSPDGRMAYCGTSQSPGQQWDESAFSASSDGRTWRQMALVDTVLGLTDLGVTPDGTCLFLSTGSEHGPESVWRSYSDPVGERWERVLTVDSSTDTVMLRLSAEYEEDETIYVAVQGEDRIAVSHDRGSTWDWCLAAPAALLDLAVADEETLYAALPGGEVATSDDEGRGWYEAVETHLEAANQLSLAADGTLLVGGRQGHVAYSRDGGESFAVIDEQVPGGGEVQVVADIDFESTGTLYVATNITDAGLWRWTLGESDDWEQLDEAATDLGAGQRVSGLAIGPEGTLYALRCEPSSSETGGMTRWLCPACRPCVDLEYDHVTTGLASGAAFDSSAVFPRALSWIQLSSDGSENRIWAIDTAGQEIYAFRDTLCKRGPQPVSPEDREVISLGSCPCERRPDLPFHWEEIEGANEYELVLHRDQEAETELQRAQTDDEGLLLSGMYEVPELAPGTTYYWRLRVAGPLLSPWSDMWCFTSALPDITGLVPSPGDTSVPTCPVFTWESPDRSYAYEFVLATDGAFENVVVAFEDEEALDADFWSCDFDLAYSTTYFWKVRPVLPDSHGEWASGAFTTEAGPVASPAAPEAATVTVPAMSYLSTIPQALIWGIYGCFVALFLGLLVSLLILMRRRGQVRKPGRNRVRTPPMAADL